MTSNIAFFYYQLYYSQTRSALVKLGLVVGHLEVKPSRNLRRGYFFQQKCE